MTKSKPRTNTKLNTFEVERKIFGLTIKAFAEYKPKVDGYECTVQSHRGFKDTRGPDEVGIKVYDALKEMISSAIVDDLKLVQPSINARTNTFKVERKIYGLTIKAFAKYKPEVNGYECTVKSHYGFKYKREPDEVGLSAYFYLRDLISLALIVDLNKETKNPSLAPDYKKPSWYKRHTQSY
jgi:hypothetical protein